MIRFRVCAMSSMFSKHLISIKLLNSIYKILDYDNVCDNVYFEKTGVKLKVNMMKSDILIIFAALLFTGQTCTGKTAKMYDRALAEWNGASIASYYLKVNYMAFSPQQGFWELEVNKGQVVRAAFNGTWDEKYIKPAGRFTVDSIFRTAEAVKSAGTDGPMVVNAEFSETVPYIRSVRRVNNEKFRGSVKKDAGFSIVIMEFREVK